MRLEAEVDARVAEGGEGLSQMDYEQLSIQHEQAESALAEQSAHAAALKTAVAAAGQQLPT